MRVTLILKKLAINLSFWIATPTLWAREACPREGEEPISIPPLVPRFHGDMLCEEHRDEAIQTIFT